MQKILNEKFNNIIENINLEKSIIVVKGITPEDVSILNIQDLFNKGMTSSWIDLYKSERKILFYEEFLYFYNFIQSEYENIYIVNNNIFENFYPLNIKIPGEIRIRLADFFDNEAVSNDVKIIDGEKYTEIYSNVKRINDTYFVRYNDEAEISNIKVKVLNLFEAENLNELKVKIISEQNFGVTECEYVKDGDESAVESSSGLNIDDNIIFIQEPEDYFKVLEKLINPMNNNYENSGLIKNEQIFVNIDNCSVNKEEIILKLQLINKYIKQIKLVKFAEKRKQNITNPRFKEILKEYWKHDSFRTLKVYDFESLTSGEKIIKEISQEDIINDIVNQVEELRANPDYDYSDVFVTAPTGSGKSAMFLIPAIYLAEKYNLVTLVISPLIGLMNDQIANLEKLSYKHAKTINSDISQIEKEEIMEDIKSGDCHILYLSPESLLARSDISQIIGERKIGMIVIDEAHIATTWGKQFRPDYWYLGDYIKKLRKQQKNLNCPFIIATFTATAIYGGIEDMYTETLDSLNMRKPITYLGYVKRDDIQIKISELKTVKQRSQYQLDKFDALVKIINRAILMEKKTLIYFPNIQLIESFYNYCKSLDLNKYITRYYGPMQAEEKKENAQLFKTKEKLIMLATKAFGMGIDISDIEIVCHFAPTGNVCDYVQEIGRAARNPNLTGEAIYSHMRNDFQHINRLHGLSTVKKYQLVKVIQKVNELFKLKLESESINRSQFSKKRNEMLVDAENFTYIFENPSRESSKEDLIPKVKTALLLIQKDYTSKMGYSPFAMRPSTLFALGYFMIPKNIIQGLTERYGYGTFSEENKEQNIYLVNLQNIWEKDYGKNLSFPNFKYLLYTASQELSKYSLNKMIPVICIKVQFTADEKAINIQNAINYILRKSVDEGIYLKVESKRNEKKDPYKNISDCISTRADISTFRANGIADILISTIKNYVRNYNKTMNSECFKPRYTNDNEESYTFNRSIENFIVWIEKIKKFIKSNLIDDEIYMIKDQGEISSKELITCLGFLESIGYLKFKAQGGLNSQIYIYVNQTKTMEEVIRKPFSYNNKLLDKVALRHKMSVAFLSYLYQSNLQSEEIWDCIEDYFLGKIRPEVNELLKKMI